NIVQRLRFAIPEAKVAGVNLDAAIFDVSYMPARFLPLNHDFCKTNSSSHTAPLVVEHPVEPIVSEKLRIGRNCVDLMKVKCILSGVSPAELQIEFTETHPVASCGAYRIPLITEYQATLRRRIHEDDSDCQ